MHAWKRCALTLSVLVGFATTADASPPSFRAYAFQASQKTGGELRSGGLSWNPHLFALGSLATGGVVGAQLLKNSAGTLIPAVDLGVSLAISLASTVRLEAQAVGVLAPLEGSSLQGSLTSSSGALGVNALLDRKFLIFDGAWVGYRRWLAADHVTEYRIGGSFRL
jgi:hypothetical protein